MHRDAIDFAYKVFDLVRARREGNHIQLRMKLDKEGFALVRFAGSELILEFPPELRPPREDLGM